MTLRSKNHKVFLLEDHGEGFLAHVDWLDGSHKEFMAMWDSIEQWMTLSMGEEGNRWHCKRPYWLVIRDAKDAAMFKLAWC